jgi:hypothetical protein
MERPIMDEQGSQLSALEQDHHVLAEAVHGMLGRIGLLEARVDYIEHGRADAKNLMVRTGYKPLPEAFETGLSHVGRALWVVDGETGLWCGKRDFDDKSPRSLLVKTPDKRGAPRSKLLYRLDALSERMAPILAKCVGNLTPTITEGTTNGD